VPLSSCRSIDTITVSLLVPPILTIADIAYVWPGTILPSTDCRIPCHESLLSVAFALPEPLLTTDVSAAMEQPLPAQPLVPSSNPGLTRIFVSPQTEHNDNNSIKNMDLQSIFENMLILLKFKVNFNFTTHTYTLLARHNSILPVAMQYCPDSTQLGVEKLFLCLSAGEIHSRILATVLPEKTLLAILLNLFANRIHILSTS
jgi:hypothetical protein